MPRSCLQASCFRTPPRGGGSGTAGCIRCSNVSRLQAPWLLVEPVLQLPLLAPLLAPLPPLKCAHASGGCSCTAQRPSNVRSGFSLGGGEGSDTRGSRWDACRHHC